MIIIMKHDIKRFTVPTGDILVIDGYMECLSLRDYGQAANVKANFLGLAANVTSKHTVLLPLEEKWVITISTQVGCAMGCKFCDVPKTINGIYRNLTEDELALQVKAALALHPEVKSTKRLNIHFARMGEPALNPNVLSFARNICRLIPRVASWLIHPVVSTSCPQSREQDFSFLTKWCNIKNDLYKGNAGLQLSINTTDIFSRKSSMPSSMSLAAISNKANTLPKPVGRKYALNFAVSPATEIDAEYLRVLFDPEKFMVKLTPMHMTQSVSKNYPYARLSTTTANYSWLEERLINQGFDVLVFVASKEEDDGMITCGNAVLSCNCPRTEYTATDYTLEIE